MKFTIGQYVCLKSHLDLYGLKLVQPLVVNERWTQECEGGTQVSYLCRIITTPRDWGSKFSAGFGFAGDSDYVRIKESELVALDAEAYRAAREARS